MRYARWPFLVVALFPGAHIAHAQHRVAIVAPTPRRELSADEQVAHVLSRLTFGARPGDAEKVAEMGVDAWIEKQLHPESIGDGDVEFALQELSGSRFGRVAPAMMTSMSPDANMAVTTSIEDRVKGVRQVTNARAAIPAATAFPMRSDPRGTGEIETWKVIRAQMTERQLLEVVTDFWSNHFSVYAAKMPSASAIFDWEREVIRPNALGKFRTLLGAVAHSPAMLFYLDNWLSRADSINENYARELLELHTLGVDGGYTQNDVIEVARAFTGWTLADPPVAEGRAYPAVFRFRTAMHDAGRKTVLGTVLPPGRGVEDGEAVLDMLAKHPSTAHFIAYKLARRLVSDQPPKALVDHAAATFTATDGDIAEVIRTIVHSQEFFSRAAFRTKVKTPFEFMVSAMRGLEMTTDAGIPSVRYLREFGQPAYGHATAEGWPDYNEAWVNSGALLKRVFFSADVLDGKVFNMQPSRWTGWSLSKRDAKTQADGVISLLLNGVAATETRNAILAAEGTGIERLRVMATVALGSPDFQRR